MESLQTSLGKKPYKFVPLTSSIKRSEFIKHDGTNKGKLYSGKIFVTIKTLTPMHISQGSSKIEGTAVINNFMRRNEKIVIPGSSFKGMIRSIFETISESCTPALPNNFSPLQEALPNKRENTCSDNNLCPTCSVFGTVKAKVVDNTNGYKGRIKFSEFELISNEKTSIENISIPALQSPFRDYPENVAIKEIREHIEKKHIRVNKSKSSNFGNERLYYADFYDNEKSYDTLSKEEYFNIAREKGENRTIKFRGRKFYLHNVNKQETAANNSLKYEMVKKDSEFKGHIIFEDFTENELSILSLALGMGQEFKYKLGYGKPAYFGSIEVNIDSVKDHNARYGKGNDLCIEKMISMAEEYKNDAKDELKKVIEKLTEVLSNEQLGKPWEQNGGFKVY